MFEIHCLYSHFVTTIIILPEMSPKPNKTKTDGCNFIDIIWIQTRLHCTKKEVFD